MERDELQRITRLIELNRLRLNQLEEQVSRLEEVRMEHAATIRGLERFDRGGVNSTMIPLGAGVQLKIDSSDIGDVVMDLGSGVHAQTNTTRAIELLTKRDNDLADLIDHLAKEHAETNELLTQYITQIDQTATISQQEPEQPTDSTIIDPNTQPKIKSKSKSKRRRRGIGTDLTLDD